MIKTIEIPQEARDNAEKANIERDSRRDILLYIIQNNLNIPQEQLEKYQKEYDEKYLAFEQAKRKIEKEYVLPATDGKALNWSLNYSNCIVTINLPDE